ncbi:hypothetical protein AAC387_Pa05g1194 [Persea americana]
MDLSVVPYCHIERSGSGEPAGSKVRYKECLRNHAAAMGGHANDGCGEFMPGSGDSELRCAACGCHRNFHRKEAPGCVDLAYVQHSHHHPVVLYGAAGKAGMVGFPTQHHHHLQVIPGVDLRREENRRSETPEEEEQQREVGPRKRFRTKFTQEQKEKMQAFAEKLGWRIQKHDDVALQEFCMEVGVKRHVLKVWMHNNKNTLAKKDPPSISSS